MENRRFHFLSVILQIASFFKSWFFPLLLIFVFNFNNDALLWTIARYVALFFIVWSIIEAILTWRTTTYRFEEEQVVLKHGIFSKTRQTIDYDRIQNIQRKTSALHKILGLTTLTLETGATGDDASIELDAIRPEEATEIERKLHAKRKQVPFGPQLPSAQWDMRLSESSRPAIEFTSKEQRTLHFEPTERDTVRATFASLSFFALIPILA
ncbi:MAG TPA: PH domain-containing protein, partial [Savagea sp.]